MCNQLSPAVDPDTVSTERPEYTPLNVCERVVSKPSDQSPSQTAAVASSTKLVTCRSSE